MNNELYHYGVKRRSGRYPWGSGKRPHQSEEKKPGKGELVDLNYAKKSLEYSKWKQRVSDVEKQNYTPKSKFLKWLVEHNDKVTQYNIDYYSKMFDKYLKQFEESGVDLSMRDAIIRLGNSSWIGKEYYIKDN